MSFETVNYAQKRVRQLGTREWKLWYTEGEDGLQFRMLTKDTAGDCYENVTGIAHAIVSEDSYIKDDDNDDAYFTERFRYATDTGVLDIYLEIRDRDLAWVEAGGDYASDACSLGLHVPLMPEVAG